MTRPGTDLALILAAAAIGVSMVGSRPEIAGIPTGDLAALLALAAVMLWLTGWAVERARPGWREAVGAVAMWAIFVTAASAVYVKREAALDGLRDLATEAGWTSPPLLSVSGTGEVAVTRGRDGSFTVPAEINDRPSSFVFDTGATAVLLTSETAQALGFKSEALRFRIPILTANGRALAAPVTLDRLSIGGTIRLSRVPALISAPGLLHQNLLGQTVLDRLESYEVRGNRLVLRAGKG
ncbi:TIGR02281 family clan AA aspartic protease [uncultured Enterovirga sp.]|uniref:retropepsin-like aspartic protease family protein n=1 Tax=uncultured Enterovirga sp. TaxID=2026352 RepID=UPI0035CC3145